jgi:hypothetical protein
LNEGERKEKKEGTVQLKVMVFSTVIVFSSSFLVLRGRERERATQFNWNLIVKNNI